MEKGQRGGGFCAVLRRIGDLDGPIGSGFGRARNRPRGRIKRQARRKLRHAVRYRAFTACSFRQLQRGNRRTSGVRLVFDLPVKPKAISSSSLRHRPARRRHRNRLLLDLWR